MNSLLHRCLFVWAFYCDPCVCVYVCACVHAGRSARSLRVTRAARHGRSCCSTVYDGLSSMQAACRRRLEARTGVHWCASGLGCRVRTESELVMGSGFYRRICHCLLEKSNASTAAVLAPRNIQSCALLPHAYNVGKLRFFFTSAIAQH